MDHPYLGFLPSGPVSLRELAGNLAQAAPYRMAHYVPGQPSVWSEPILQGVDHISSFAAVVVLTENADTARAWIEQVQPRLNQTPLLIAVSAQSGPVIQPYLDSQQIQGLISGLSGAAVYEQLFNQPGRVRVVWDSYQLGLLVAMALIISGALLQGAAAVLSHRKGKNKA